MLVPEGVMMIVIPKGGGKAVVVGASIAGCGLPGVSKINIL
jgi:hypothetical protein